MTYRGVARGNTIELEEPLPFAEGQAVSVSVEPIAAGNAAALLEAVRGLPHVEPEAVDEMLRAIHEARLPVNYRGVFDDLAE